MSTRQDGPLLVGAVDQDTPGKIVPLLRNAAGELIVTSGGASGSTVDLISVGGEAIELGQATMADSLPVVIASDQSAVHVIVDSGGGSNASVGATGAAVPASATYVGRLDASGNLAGLVSGHGTAATAIRVELPTDGTGVIATVGAVTTVSTVTAITNPVTVTGTVTASNVTGNVAADAADSGNPVKVGYIAYSPDGTTPGTAVAELDRSNAKSDLDGRQYVNTAAPRWWSYHSDGSSALTDASVQADPGDGFQIVITSIIFSTGFATACNIFFEEGSTKILGPWYLEAVAGRGVVWIGEKKVTASTALTVTTSAAIAQSVDVQGYIQAV